MAGWLPLPAILVALLPATPAAAGLAAPMIARDQPPQCATASHERLLLRDGRDVCAPTLSASGRPTAAGFMPTQCPAVGQSYRIDAAGKADRCRIIVSGSEE